MDNFGIAKAGIRNKVLPIYTVVLFYITVALFLDIHKNNYFFSWLFQEKVITALHCLEFRAKASLLLMVRLVFLQPALRLPYQTRLALC